MYVLEQAMHIISTVIYIQYIDFFSEE